MRKHPKTGIKHDLGTLSPAWSGWVLIDDCLYSPENWEIPVNWVQALPLTREALHASRMAGVRQRQEALQARDLTRAVYQVVEAMAAARNALDGLEAALPATARQRHALPAACA